MNKKYLAIIISIFVFASLFIGIMAAKVYETNITANRLNEADDAITYFTAAIKEDEHLSELRVASINRELPALVMQNNVAGDISETWIYVYDDYLCSLSQPSEQSINPDEGERILPLKSADFIMLRNNLIEITFTTVNDNTVSMNLHIADMEGGI